MDGSMPMLVAVGLSTADQADLLELLPSGGVELEVQPLPPGELGEPVTAMLLLTLSFAAVTGLCTWLAAKGRHVKWQFEIRAPGNVGGSFSLEIGGDETPAHVVERIEEKGIVVAPR